MEDREKKPFCTKAGLKQFPSSAIASESKLFGQFHMHLKFLRSNRNAQQNLKRINKNELH